LEFAATLFNLQQLYFICSNFILFAARFFNLQQVYLIRGDFLVCGMSLVGHRSFEDLSIMVNLHYSKRERDEPLVLHCDGSELD